MLRHALFELLEFRLLDLEEASLIIESHLLLFQLVLQVLQQLFEGRS